MLSDCHTGPAHFGGVAGKMNGGEVSCTGPEIRSGRTDDGEDGAGSHATDDGADQLA